MSIDPPLKLDTQTKKLIICRRGNAKAWMLNGILMSGVMLNAIILSVAKLNFIQLSVVAP
jgi:hypothetical protein